MPSMDANDAVTSLTGLVLSLPDSWHYVPKLYFFRIEATFHSAKTALASESDDFDTSKLVEMVGCMMEVDCLSPTTVARVSQPVTSSTPELTELKAICSCANRSVCLAGPKAATVGVPVLAPEPKMFSRRVNAAEFSGNSTGHMFNVCDSKIGPYFLVDTGAQIIVITPTPADRRCPNHGLFLPALNSSPIPTFVSRSLSHDIGLRSLFPWIFIVADFPISILAADLLAAFDLPVDCRHIRLHDRATILSVKGFHPLPISNRLSDKNITVFMDQKPLFFSLKNNTSKINPQELRRLQFILQLTSCIRHIDGAGNALAAVLSRPSIAHLQLSPALDLAEMVAELSCVGLPCDEDVSGLQL
ncbi:unnamed protein product [Schistocephalus solidus]|uniref:Peptidase A2 domain-containing protein n=1 Tax=Schistocephalus solidus TaxID=70667 RepID=A0A183TI97_SCHSO|nr:unnamed protein product [Schistocephalus solidus]